MKYTELKNHIISCLNGEESFAPAYLVGGTDAYLGQSAGKMFKSVVNPEYADFNLSYVSRDNGPSAVADALTLYPVFDERKVVIVPDVSGKLNEGEKGMILTYLASPNPTSVLVIVSEGEGDKEFAKKANMTYVDCNKLSEGEIGVEVDGLLSVPPVRVMENGALHLLVEKTASDMSRIVCEIEKLKAYTDKIIKKSDVEEMVAADLSYATWAITNAIADKDGDAALRVLDVFARQGMKPTATLSTLYFQYRNLLHVGLHKNDDPKALAAILGVSSGQLFHLKKAADQYSQMKLKKCVDYLHNLQYDILSGRRAEESALHEAVLTLLNL